MKLIYTILFFCALSANATTYYVDNSGSDAASGLSTEAAWQTIAKVNSFSFTLGDSVLLKKNGSWNERLVPPVANMYYGSYGTGVKPLITGFQTQEGFTNVGNIWTATATNSVRKLNIVLINGSLQKKARTPNTGWSTFSSYSGQTQITTALTGTPNYTGSEAVVRSANWVIDVTKITSQSGGVLNLSPPLTYTPQYGGNGYFIQNTASDLDLQGEWCYDSTTKVLKVYSTSSPTVQISTIDTLVWVRQNYLTFDGLSLSGANLGAFQLDTASHHVTIKNCSINYSGFGIIGNQNVRCIVLNDSIQNSLSDGVYLRVNPYVVHAADSTIVSGNYIKNTGIWAGMAMSGNNMCTAIYLIGDSNTITNNRIDSVGYIGINFNGKSLVKNNYITTFCFVKDDGGGIYSFIGTYYTPDFDAGSVVRKNIVLNGTGAVAGTNLDSYASGIYLDANAKGVTVDSNTVNNCYHAALFLNNTNTNIVRNNLIIDSIGLPLQFGGENTLTIKNNIFYSKTSEQYVVYTYSTTFANTIDSNRYLRPVSEANKMNYNGIPASLTAWATATGYDAHSGSTPLGITSDLPLIYYNPTLSDSTIILPGTYIDALGKLYASTIILQPFTSALLFRMPFTLTDVKLRNFKRIISL